MLHQLGDDDADGEEIEEDGDKPIEHDDAEENEDDAYIPLRHHTWCPLVFLCYRGLCLVVVHADVAEDMQIVVASVVEDTVLDIAVSLVGIVVECLQFLVGPVVCHDVLQ